MAESRKFVNRQVGLIILAVTAFCLLIFRLFREPVGDAVSYWLGVLGIDAGLYLVFTIANYVSRRNRRRAIVDALAALYAKAPISIYDVDTIDRLEAELEELS